MCDTPHEQEIPAILKKEEVHVYPEMRWNQGLNDPGMGWKVVCVEE